MGDFQSKVAQANELSAFQSHEHNLQTMSLLKAAKNVNPNPSQGGGNIVIVDNRALMSTGGASQVVFPDESDATEGTNGEISIYVVREGDTLSQIAELFDVTANTIRWANDIDADEYIQEGDMLIILPIPGVRYTLKEGDTIKGIAEEFSGSVEEILQYNGISNASSVSPGETIIIPHGEIATIVSHHSSVSAVKVTASPARASTQTTSGYFIKPLPHYTRTQGIHGYNAVDLGAPIGTPVYAAASGNVIISRNNGGWNGGYGNYVVIKHANGTQTLYGHMSEVLVGTGRVVQGEVIGFVGSTGHSTGPHLHFEVRGGVNPF